MVKKRLSDGKGLPPPKKRKEVHEDYSNAAIIDPVEQKQRKAAVSSLLD